MIPFTPQKMYRLCWIMDDEKLRGRPVIFHEMRVFARGDITRCRVRLVLPDGSEGEELLVASYCIINM